MQNYNTMVSIIMPAYNSADTIQESIDSVISQVYDNWELIVVDDSSTDNTKAIVNSYLRPNIRLLINKYPKGAAGARKTAIENANGRYIAFLDSDDIWTPGKLKKQLDFMHRSGAVFVYSDYSTFKSNVKDVISLVSPPERLSYNELIKNCMIGCLTVVLDRKAFYDFEFPLTPKEDYAFWLKLLRQVDAAYRVPNVNSFYRLAGGSLSGNKFKEIRKQWVVVRKVEKTAFFHSLYCIACYVFNGVLKHYLPEIKKL